MKAQTAKLNQPMVVTPIPIVCGDCGGDRLLPVETLMTRDGCCASCGGRSFTNAELIYRALLRHHIGEINEYHSSGK